MPLIDTIKAAQLQARKDKNEIAKLSLTTLIGEAEAVGKKSNRAPTDDEVVKVISKTLDNLTLFIEAVQGKDAVKTQALQEEHALLSAFKPIVTYMPENDLRNIIREEVAALVAKGQSANVGAVMSFLKTNHAGNYDAKLASAIVKEMV